MNIEYTALDVARETVVRKANHAYYLINAFD